jgi:hypothetical protein
MNNMQISQDTWGLEVGGKFIWFFSNTFCDAWTIYTCHPTIKQSNVVN